MGGRVKAESGQSRGRVKAESQPESMQGRILEAFASGPLSKAEISDSLGMKRVTGYLNRIVRELLSEGRIEYTIPEKPNSRLQKYRLTDKKKKDN